jgi:putative tryptophan/tyrosine transport system substrate-binding protein
MLLNKLPYSDCFIDHSASMEKTVTIRKTYLLFFLILCFPLSAVCKEYRVAVFDYDIRSTGKITIAEHIEKQLRNTNLRFHEINHFNGEENQKKAMDVLAGLDSKNYDLIITITSDSMIPAIHTISRTPLLFTNINNPRFFGIQNPRRPGRNMSGVTYYVPVAKQIALFQKIMGEKLCKLGMIFDKHAKSRRAELWEFRSVTQKMKITSKIVLVDKSENLPEAAKKLFASHVDAIVVTSSDKIYDHFESIIDICTNQKIPIFSVNKNGVAKGAIAAFACDYYMMVDECLIPMAIEVLDKGVNPGTMPVRSLKNPSIYLNLTQSKKLGLIIPDEILKIASKIY